MSKKGFFVIDDGTPDGSDYDDNYVFYDTGSPESYAAALKEVRRRCAVVKALYPKLDCACSSSRSGCACTTQA